MGLLNFFARRKALTASPGVVEALQDGRFNTYQRLGGVNQQVNAAFLQAQSSSYAFMYERQPAVRTVVDYIARNVAQLGLKLYERKSDNERERNTDHPAAQTMYHPNDLGPGEQFIFNFVADYLVHDNAYALKFRGPVNGPRTLIQIPPPAVAVNSAARFTIENYRIYRSDGTYFDVDPADVIHWRGYNPSDPRIGVSRLETLRLVLAEEAAAQAASIELSKSGLAKPGYIKRPVEAADWTEEARQRFQESWANQSKQSPRKTPVLEEGMEFADFGVSPKDAEMLAGRRFTLETVARLYGLKNVPPEDEEERKQVYADVLPPITEQLACQLDFSLLRQEYGEEDFYFEFDLNEKLRGDPVARFQAITAAVGAPWLLRDEARAMENRPPIDGGDEIITPLNVLVGDNPRPAPNVMPPQDPNGPEQDGSYRERALSNGKATPLLPRRAALAGRRAEYAQEHEGLLRSFFSRQERSTKSKGAQAKAVNDERWNTELAEDLLRLARQTVAREGGIAAARMAADFDMAQVRNFLAAAAQGQAEGINGATADQLRSEDFEAVFDRAKNVRAPNGAMALATGLISVSTREAIKQTAGSERRVVSISGGDCPLCDPYQGQWAASELAAWPPYHPSCDCIADVAA